jgi:hypothetical protein
MRLLAGLLLWVWWLTPALAGFNEPASVLFGNTATAATAIGTGEQILATYSLPANALNVVGRRLWVHAQFSSSANTNTKTFRLYFGAQAITNTTAVSVAGSVLDLYVTKSGANTQIVTGDGRAGAVLTALFSAAGANTDTAAIVIKATCQDTTSAAADCTLQDFSVRWMN